jgi:CheY-like chemotaxis protein
MLELYAQIMQERFADRVTLKWNIDSAALGGSVPALLLQPLLENAFNHGVERSRDAVRIEVEARRDGERMHIAIRNTGPVLGSDRQEGVGLRNCRERLSGCTAMRRKCSSRSSRRGRSSVTLPGRAPRVRERSSPMTRAPARGKLQRWLSEQPDIEVVAEAEDGLRAAEAIERLKPEVAFLDIQMPGLSGLEVAAQLEQETAPLIVFVTAFDEHAIKAFELNAIDYLRSRTTKTGC